MADSQSHSPSSLPDEADWIVTDPLPRRDIDWDLFWTDDGYEVQMVDTPDRRETRVLSSDDEAAAFVLACATRVPDDEDGETYAEAHRECREALKELILSWEDDFPGPYWYDEEASDLERKPD